MSLFYWHLHFNFGLTGITNHFEVALFLCEWWRLHLLGAAGKAANLGGCKSLYRQLLDSDG